jgi:glucosamine--fructose-6-phosphate aminotransferase (isomerizing)
MPVFRHDDFPHQMLREIYEQPAAIERTTALYLSNGGLKPELAEKLAKWSNPAGEILIVASGSSRHSGLAAEMMLEDLCGLAVDVEYSSEYSCRGSQTLTGLALRHPSVLVLSQSGETSDTLASLNAAHAHGQRTLAITNAPESTMARTADISMPLAAGKELSIPATKSFCCQLVVLYLLTLYEGAQVGQITPEALRKHIADLEKMPALIEKQLDGWRASIATLAAKYKNAASFLFLGRGVHYAIAREGALKLKEASYVHAEGYPTGELKHGPNALVSDSVPLVIIATVDRSDADSVVRYEKTLQLLRDMKKQGSKVIALANTGDEEVRALVNDFVAIEPASEHLLPIAEIVPLQLFSYFMALEHGVDVDRPRNLTKAVIE